LVGEVAGCFLVATVLAFSAAVIPSGAITSFIAIFVPSAGFLVGNPTILLGTGHDGAGVDAVVVAQVVEVDVLVRVLDTRVSQSLDDAVAAEVEEVGVELKNVSKA
jgi:hypothetical protein